LSSYRYTGVSVESIPSAPHQTNAGSLQSNRGQSTKTSRQEDGNQLVAPIYLRGQSLGSIVIKRDPDEAPWTTEDVALLDDVSAQIGLALENARLLEETQQRARQDRIIADITARVRSSLDPETILQTAVRELGTALGTDRAFVRLGGARQDEQEK
ncbi:MAG TPA: GAF domain-containing protein, partial [Chloroflexi bacterium]|nr:GAF domain-containing protein [Chloroflexota bacterium]